MLKFLTKKNKEVSKGYQIDDATKRVIRLKRHQAQQKLKVWQQTHLI
jgi:hypothetical protein